MLKRAHSIRYCLQVETYLRCFMTDNACHFLDLISGRKMFTPSIWNVLANVSTNSLAGNSHERDEDTRVKAMSIKEGIIKEPMMAK